MLECEKVCFKNSLTSYWSDYGSRKKKNWKITNIANYPRAVRELNRVWEICRGWWRKTCPRNPFDDTRMNLFYHDLRNLPSYQGVWCDVIVKINELFINTCLLHHKFPASNISATSSSADDRNQVHWDLCRRAGNWFIYKSVGTISRPFVKLLLEF